jgi:hypothetical protein
LALRDLEHHAHRIGPTRDGEDRRPRRATCLSRLRIDRGMNASAWLSDRRTARDAHHLLGALHLMITTSTSGSARARSELSLPVAVGNAFRYRIRGLGALKIGGGA